MAFKSKSSRRREVIVRGFFTQLFGKKSSEVQLLVRENGADLAEFDALDDEGEIVLTEMTRGDGSVASIVYRNGGVIDASAVDTLCAKVNWPRRPVPKLAVALRKSFLVSHIHLRICYDDERETEEKLIGMARATSDHAFNATIWDVIVDPDYQNRGLGKCLVEQMVRALLRRDITNISLFADAHVVRFYERMGFEADPDGIKGMFWCPPN